MAQILDPIPNEQKDSILCCYVNATSQMQIVRITNINNWYFERVAFPGQRLVFEALPTALLEIHTGMMASAILSDTIPCDRLCLSEDRDDEKLTEPVVENKLSSRTVDSKNTQNNLLSFVPALASVS